MSRGLRMGPALRRLRLSRQLTAAGLGARIGISRSAVYELEKGDRNQQRESIERYLWGVDASWSELAALLDGHFDCALLEGDTATPLFLRWGSRLELRSADGALVSSYRSFRDLIESALKAGYTVALTHELPEARPIPPRPKPGEESK